MQANIEYLSRGEVDASRYFQLSDIRYNYRDAVINFRTRYRVQEADLRILRLLR